MKKILATRHRACLFVRAVDDIPLGVSIGFDIGNRLGNKFLTYKQDFAANLIKDTTLSSGKLTPSRHLVDHELS